MTLTILIGFGIVVGGWSFLSVLGNERQRKVQDLERKRAEKQAEAPVGD